MPMFGTRVRDNLAAIDANRVEAPDPVASAGKAAILGLDAPAGWIAPVSSATAQTVPAYRRARTLVASSIGLLSLRQRDAAGNVLPSIPFLRNPDPTRVTSALIAQTVGDLCDYGVAYWLNPDWDSPDGWRYNDSERTVRKHKAVRHLPVTDIVEVTDNGYRLQSSSGNGFVPSYAVVAFECSAGAWLTHGVRAITTSMTLEDAARVYASTPQATTVLRNTGPRKTPDQVSELVTSWETARKSRSTAYDGTNPFPDEL